MAERILGYDSRFITISLPHMLPRSINLSVERKHGGQGCTLVGCRAAKTSTSVAYLTSIMSHMCGVAPMYTLYESLCSKKLHHNQNRAHGIIAPDLEHVSCVPVNAVYVPWLVPRLNSASFLCGG